MLNLRISNGHFSNPEAKFSNLKEVKKYRSECREMSVIGMDVV